MSEQKKETGVVQIHGKDYKTVALRVTEFHGPEPEKGSDQRTPLGERIVTELIHRDAQSVVMKASILDKEGNVLATGHGEEFRSAGNINRTSAMENAETSAIGRALAAHGFGGTEFASANEVVEARRQQQKAGPEHVAAVQAYLGKGLITNEHLMQRFGHADPNRLLLVEANRIINAISAQQKLKEMMEMEEPKEQ